MSETEPLTSDVLVIMVMEPLLNVLRSVGTLGLFSWPVLLSLSTGGAGVVVGASTGDGGDCCVTCGEREG